MRKQRLVLMLIMLMLTGNLFAQVEWQWLNPVITCNTLYDSDFINEQTGFITGEIGTLYKTNNAGTNWQKIFLPVTSNFNSIKFVNSTTGIISGDNSLILRTTNTGVNWVSVSNPGSGTLKDILYISSSFVLCVGGNSILKSTDLGLTWTNLSAYSTPYNFIKADYIDANNIFIAGYYFLYQFPTPIQRSVVLKSTNAGASWTEINVSGSSKFTSIKIINANNILITGNGDGAVFFKSTDQGNSWQNKTTSLVYENMGDMDFFDSNTGFAMASSGSNGRRFTTTDGGESWASVSLSGKFLNSVAVISQTQAYAAGVNGCLLKTTNKGANWVQLNEGFNIFGNFVNAHFLNENTGYAAGIGFGYPTYQGGSILKTTNGGSTWIYQSDTTISYGVLTDIYFTSVTRGYVCGENGLILRTTNSGTRWTYSLPTSYNLNSIRFSDSLNGVTCGGRVVMKTANGGNNWNTVYTDNNAQFVSVHFINNLTGTAIAKKSGGLVIHTTNGGSSWTEQSLGIDPNIYSNLTDVLFVNETTGFIIGEYSNFYKTTNGGVNWMGSQLPSRCNRMKFINSTTGFFVGNAGAVYITTNQGVSFSARSVKTSKDLYGLSFINENTGVVVGNFQSILKTGTGGLVNINLNTAPYVIPFNFSLFQNYPNPFNPSTVIRYQLLVAGFTSLKVFDLLGKEVAILVNEKQNAGSYAVDFNSAEFNLPSGIYFYTLNAGEFKETKKMILIK